MSQIPVLELHDFELGLDGSARLSLSAAGRLLSQDGSPLGGMPLVRLGMGPATAVPVLLASAFPEQASEDRSDEQVYLMTVDEPAAVSSWMLSLRSRLKELLLVQKLTPSLTGDFGLQLEGLLLQLAVGVREGGLDLLKVLVVGTARLDGSFFGLGLQQGRVRMRLELEFSRGDALAGILSDPAQVIGNAFKGTLTLEAGAQALSLGSGALVVRGSRALLSCAVSSPAGAHELTLGDLEFSISAASFSAGGIAFTAPALSGQVRKDGRSVFSADAKVELSPLWRSALESSAASAQVAIRFTHATTPAASSFLQLSLSRFRLLDALNPLKLRAAELELSLRHSGGAWQLHYHSDIRLQGAAFAESLKRSSLPQLPFLAGLGSLDIAFDLSLSTLSNQGAVSLAVNGKGLERPLGMELRLEQTLLEFSLVFSTGAVGAWSLRGHSSLTTLGGLHALLPLQRCLLGVALVNSLEGGLRAEFSLQGGLPVLQLSTGLRGQEPLRLFQLQSLRFSLGDGVEMEGRAALLPGFNPATFAAALGAAPLAPLFAPLAEALRLAAGDITVSLFSRGDAEARVSSLRILCRPANPPVFNLLKLCRQLPGVPQRPRGESQPEAGDDFFQVTPRGLAFDLRLEAGSDSLGLAVQTDCILFGESFSADLSLRLLPSGPELSFLAGSRDPIQLCIPAPDPDAILGALDLPRLARDYQLDAQAQTALKAACEGFCSHFTSAEARVAFIFEIHDLGLRIKPSDTDNPVSLSGSVRLVRAPRELDDVLGLEGFSVTLGATPTSVFLAMGSDGSRPLLDLPVGVNRRAQLMLRELQFSYSWSLNAFSFAWNVDVSATAPGLGVATPLGGVFVPGLSSSASFGVTATVPPLPIPEFSVNFSPLGRSPSTLGDDLGLQVFLGPTGQRLLTLYWKELCFSPTLYLFQPGLRFSGGFLAGGPSLTGTLRLDELRTQLTEPSTRTKRDFYVFVDVDQASAILMGPVIGVLINPGCILPPFVTATPPYWVAPPTLMGDLYFRQLNFALNIPNLVFASLHLSRPLVSPNLQQVAELVALVMSGFSHPLPAGSSLESLFFAKLRGELEIAIPGGSQGKRKALLELEVNLADLINGFISLAANARTALENGAKLLDLLINDPVALVRMIPFESRNIALNANDGLDVCGLNISGSGSVYLMTPEELHGELQVYHENKRVVPRGLAAVTKASAPSFHFLPGAPVLVTPRRQVSGILSKAVPVQPESAFDFKDPVLNQFLERRSKELVSANLRKRQLIEALQNDTRRGLEQRWDQLVNSWPAGKAPTGARLRALLLKAGFDTAQSALIEKELQKEGPALSALKLPQLRGKVSETLLSSAGVKMRLIPRPGEVRPFAATLAAVPRTWASLRAPAPEASVLKNELLSRLKPNLARINRVKDLVLFDGERLRSLLADKVGQRPRTPVTTLVQEIVGYDIVARTQPKNQSRLAISVPGESTRFDIRLLHGVYQLCHRSGAGPEQRSALPAWLLEQAAPGPRRSERLRSKLKIVPRTLSRPITAAEEKTVAPLVKELPKLYESSVLFRPEYRLADTGGKRGPLCLADFLINNDSSYQLPKGPVLLAGLQVAVTSGSSTWFTLQLAGMLAPPANVLLFGKQSVTLRAGALALSMEGEFRLLAGDLWSSGSSEFPKDALSFSGLISLTQNGRTKFRANAAGSITSLSSNPKLSLSFELAVDFEQSIDAGGDDLVRVTAQAKTRATLSYSLSGFSLSVGGGFEASVWLLLPPVKRVEYCGPLGCVTIDEPQILDFDHYEPRKVGSVQGGLSFKLTQSGLEIEASVDLRNLGGLNFGQHRFLIDHLD